MRKLILICFLFQSLTTFSQENMEVYLPKNFKMSDTVYFEKGSTKEIMFYNENNTMITKLTFYENQMLESCLNFKASNFLDGLVTYWYENGQKKLTSFYANGKIVGDKNIGWHESGEMSYKTICSDDTCVTEHYEVSGKLYKVTKSDKDGRLFYQERWCENGQLLAIDSIGVYQFSYKENNCNGSIKIEASKNKRGSFVGKYKSYFENGELESEGRYVVHGGFETLKDGEWKYFNEEGEIVLVENYKQ